MVDFFQNIFGKVISLMASAIIAVGLVFTSNIPEQPLPTEKTKGEVVIEKIDGQEMKQNKNIKVSNQEIQNQKTEEPNAEVETLKEEIKNLESYLREHYDYVPRVRQEQNETIIDFLKRQKKTYTETIEKAQKIENKVEALNRGLAEGKLIQKQIACLEKLGIYKKVLEDIEKIKDSSGGVEEPIDTRPFIEEQYLKVENLCNE